MNDDQTQFDEMFQSFGPNSKNVLSEESKFFNHSDKLIKPNPI
jgi:hypothetical protein